MHVKGVGIPVYYSDYPKHRINNEKIPLFFATLKFHENSFQKIAGRENCAKGEWQEKDGGVNVELIRISTKV